MHDQIKIFFQDSLNSPNDFSYLETIDADHGRIETRRYWTNSDIECLQGKEKWAGIIGTLKTASTGFWM